MSPATIDPKSATPAPEKSVPRDRIREAVKAEIARLGNVSIVALAAKAGVRRSRLYRWLKGQGGFRTESASRVIEALGSEMDISDEIDA